MYDFITAGYPSLDTILSLDSDIRIGSTSIINKVSSQSLGGCAVNIAYAGASYGMKTALATIVGEDFLPVYMPLLKKNGVDVSCVDVIEGMKTSMSFLVETEKGDHYTLFHQGAMNSSQKFHENTRIFQKTKLGVVTVGERNYIECFAESCMRHNVPLVFGMKCDTSAFSKEFLIHLVENSQFLFMNRGESEVIKDICSCTHLDMLNKKAKCVVITKGSEGSEAYFKNGQNIEKVDIPIVPSEVVDLTGVGDAYMAGFLYGHASGQSYPACGRMGAVSASFAAEGVGCLSLIPSCADFLDRYQKYFL